MPEEVSYEELVNAAHTCLRIARERIVAEIDKLPPPDNIEDGDERDEVKARLEVLTEAGDKIDEALEDLDEVPI